MIQAAISHKKTPNKTNGDIYPQSQEQESECNDQHHIC